MEKARNLDKSLESLVKLAFATHDTALGEYALAKMMVRNPDKRVYLDGYLGLLDKTRRLDFITTATEAAPIDFELRLRMAEAYRERGDIKNFERELLKAEIIDPKNRIAVERLYDFYRSKNDAVQMATYATKLRDAGGNPDQVTSGTMIAKLPEGVDALRNVLVNGIMNTEEAQRQPDEFVILRALESYKAKSLGVPDTTPAQVVSGTTPMSTSAGRDVTATERIGQDTTEATIPAKTATALTTTTSAKDETTSSSN
jgi:hypothetical protein